MALSGLIICFSGTLSMPRSAFTKQAESEGAKVGSSVTGKTTHLVAGPGAGSKLSEAQSKGVTVWSEAEYLAAIGGGSGGGGGKKKAAPKAAPKAAAAPKQKGKRGAAKKQEAEMEDDGEEEEEAAPPKKAAKTAAAKPKGKAKAGAAAAAAAAPAASSGGGGGGGGAKRVDRCVPNADAYTVCGDLAVKLMQTNIGGGSNNNKFYILQTLQGQGQYKVLFRWGRLGEPGQNKIEVFSTLEAAQARFEKQFREKTKNAWSARDSFVKHDGKYQLVETEDGDGDDEGADGAALGKLTRAQIEKGQAVLAQLRTLLSSSSAKPSSAAVSQLSGSFYSLIPTTSGRVAPPPLSSEEMLTEKEGLLEFWLRMGFESVESTEQPGSPIEGVQELPLPPTLSAAASNVSDTSSISSSRTRGATLAKAKAGGPTKKMDAELYGAIMLYTGNSIYRRLNQALRENWKAVKPFHKYLRLYFEAMSCLPARKVTLWRGIAADLYPTYVEGSVQTWWSISSCTAAKGVAQGFMQQLGGKATLLTLECKNAVDVSALSFYPHEAESLLLPGTQLRVLSRKREGNVAHIHVEEV